MAEREDYKALRLAGKWPPKVSVVGHERRCEASSRKREDGRCGNWASRKMRYCRYHGGHKSGEARVISKGLYSKGAKSALTMILDTVADHDDHRLSLRSELEAARAMAMHSMKVFGASLELPADKVALQQVAAEHAHKSLELVQKLVLQMAKVQVLDPRVMDVEQVNEVITKVGNILAQHLTTDEIVPILADIRKIQVDTTEKPVTIVL